MSVLAAIRPVDIVAAVGAGIAAASAASAGVALLSARQRRRVQSLAHATVGFEAMRGAAVRAQRDEPDVLEEIVRSAISDVAGDQNLGDGLVAGALFAPVADGSLEILEGQWVNLDEPELPLRAQRGETGLSEAVRTGHPVVTVFRSPVEASSVRDPQERERINPSLRWIIAVPVLAEDHRPIWILSIAGLVEPRTQEQLESSVAHLLYYRELLELVLKAIARKNGPRAKNHQ